MVAGSRRTSIRDSIQVIKEKEAHSIDCEHGLRARQLMLGSAIQEVAEEEVERDNEPAEQLVEANRRHDCLTIYVICIVYMYCVSLLYH